MIFLEKLRVRCLLSGYYAKRAVRIREQDDLMMRNENFVRLNFRPLPLSVHPDAPENSSASAPEPGEVTSPDPGQT